MEQDAQSISGNIALKLEGAQLLGDILEKLPAEMVDKALPRAMDDGITQIVRMARITAPVEAGLLRQSLSKKVKQYSSKVVVAMAGANTATKGFINKHDRKGNPSKWAKRVPWRYIHLVEKGHGGPRPAPPFRFLEAAWEMSKDFAQQAAADTLRRALEEATRGKA